MSEVPNVSLSPSSSSPPKSSASTSIQGTSHEPPSLTSLTIKEDGSTEQVPVPGHIPNKPTHQQNEGPPKLKSILPPLSACLHNPCYCEENIWLLCDKIRTHFEAELVHCIVAFISNPKRMVPLWRQKSGKTEDKLSIWDYHVILLYKPDDRCVVYDLDSDLPFPTHFHKYVTETFRTESILQPEYHRFFRIIQASKFLNLFSSDRSHMIKGDGTYLHSPPPYPPIYRNGVNNLDSFVDMTSTAETEFGEVLSLMDLVRRFYKVPKRPS